jgi:hypothetical protein
MSDGREEREELRERRGHKVDEDREDWVDRAAGDEWQPERADS